MIDTEKKQQTVWKTYPDYPFIEVNQFGIVRTKDRIVIRKDGKKYHVKGYVLKQYKNSRGYTYITFGVNNKTVTLRVHRLVAICFIPNPENLPEVNHIDCNRANNNVDNLEWCSHEYNMTYREEHGIALNCSVFAVNLKTSKVLYFESQHEASRELGISVQNINGVLKGRKKQTGGYWFTEDESEITEEKIQKIRNNMYFFGGVIAVSLETRKVLYFESQAKASHQLQIEAKLINKVLKKRQKTTNDYWFCYADKNAVKKVREKFGDDVAREVEKMVEKNYD